MQSIHLNLTEAQQKSATERWLVAINSKSLEAKLVRQQLDGFVPEVEGHEDLFPLSMAFEANGYLEGGDWLVARTPNPELHDGLYRSYQIIWDVTPSQIAIKGRKANPIF